MTFAEAVKKTCAAILVGAVCAVAASLAAEGDTEDFVWEIQSERGPGLPAAAPLRRAHA